MPLTTPPVKISAVKALKAQIILFGDFFLELVALSYWAKEYHQNK